MRNFYIFDINNEFISITKTHPYALYKSFLDLHEMNKDEIKYGINIYNYLTKNIDKNFINNLLYSNLKDDNNYTKFLNIHNYNNYYNNEETKLTINNSYIKIESNSNIPLFFKYLYKYSHLFVCDFDNEDYFYLENIA